jgi:hypothetical protein
MGYLAIPQEVGNIPEISVIAKPRRSDSQLCCCGAVWKGRGHRNAGSTVEYNIMIQHT